MGAKKYCDTNMHYLCERNRMTPEELRLTLDMSKLQFYSLGYKASKAIADYFGKSFDEFMYTDFRIPESYRYLAILDQKERLCKLLMDSLEKELAEWKIISDDLVDRLYGHNMYKQAAFCLEKEDYTFAIIMNLPYDSVPDDECVLFQKGCFAYGYVRFETEYNRYFMSFENAKFKELCDRLLQMKCYPVEEWITRPQYLQKNGHSLSGSISVEDIIGNKEQFLSKAINFAVYFGKNAYSELSENEQLELLKHALQYIDLLKRQGNVKNIDISTLSVEEQHLLFALGVNENGILECSIDVLEEVENEFRVLIDSIKDEIGEREERRLREEKEKRCKDTLYQEMKDARSQLGKWSTDKVTSFAKSIAELTVDELFEQLKWIRDLYDTDNEEYSDMCESEKQVLANFIWAKRLYVFQYTDGEALCDNIISFGSTKREEVYMLLKFIGAYKNHEINEYYHGLSSVYAEMLVFLFGFLPETKEEIRVLREYHILAGINNALLDNLYEDICIINCVSDGTIVVENKKPISSSIIYELTLAQWTNFFEDSEDKVMYKACDDVYESVDLLFENYGIKLSDFFAGRKCKKRYRLFSCGRNEKMDVFAMMVTLNWNGKTFIRKGYKYYVEDGKIYLNGIFDTIELLDRNGYNFSYPLVDRYLATAIWKYMENYLRIMSKYKTKCTYKYGGYYCFDAFLNDKDTPKAIRDDYTVMKTLLETNKLRDAVYVGMEAFLEKNPEEMLKWKNIFVK